MGYNHSYNITTEYLGLLTFKLQINGQKCDSAENSSVELMFMFVKNQR